MFKRLIQILLFSIALTVLFVTVVSMTRPLSPSPLRGEFPVKVISVEPISEMTYSGKESTHETDYSSSKHFPVFYAVRLQVQSVTATPPIDWRVRVEDEDCTPVVGDIVDYRGTILSWFLINGEKGRACSQLQGYPAPPQTHLSWFTAKQSQYGSTLTGLMILGVIFIITTGVLACIGGLRIPEEDGPHSAIVARLAIAAGGIAVVLAIGTVVWHSQEEQSRQQEYARRQQVATELERKIAGDGKAAEERQVAILRPQQEWVNAHLNALKAHSASFVAFKATGRSRNVQNDESVAATMLDACKLSLAIHSETRSDDPSSQDFANDQKCVIDMAGLPDSALEIKKLDTNALSSSEVYARGDTTWLLTIADKSHVDCTSLSDPNTRDWSASLTFTREYEAKKTLESIKGFVHKYCPR